MVDESEQLEIILWNECTYPAAPDRAAEKLPGAASVADLCKRIAARFELKSEGFLIQINGGKPFENAQTSSQSLESLVKKERRLVVYIKFAPGFDDTTVSTNPSFSSRTSPEDMLRRRESETVKIREREYVSTGMEIVPFGPLLPGQSNVAGPYSVRSGWTDFSKRAAAGFVGLSNQGATCYMNSLLQSLYMTPEFRQALYSFDFDDIFEQWYAQKLEQRKTDPSVVVLEDKSEAKKQREKDLIARQLQLLFARLQCRTQRAVKTKDLTSSFGWTDDEAFTQHDVQELMRVLFDALEHVLENTDQSNFSKLWEGKMVDYVHCMDCHSESSREDTFMDIPLVIRGFGETVPVGSVEEALGKFTAVEMLDGDNQYECSTCGRKTDARKGLKFSAFPYLLALQLKRFDFDYETFRRIKLNDYVTFPGVLNMNRFLGDATQAQGVQDAEDLPEGMDINTTSQIGTHEEQIKVALQDGPYVYELYSILIHRGSALGGHYYAYIREFDSGRWFEFNDSQVTAIPDSQIETTFGDLPELSQKTGFSAMFSSSANAYMLLYRQVDSERNISNAAAHATLPEALQRIMQDENSAFEKRQVAAELDKQMRQIKCFYRGAEKELNVHMHRTLGEVTLDCARAFHIIVDDQTDQTELNDVAMNTIEIEDVRVDAANIRIRAYSAFNDIPGEPYDSAITRSLTLEQLGVYQSKTVLLELKDDAAKPWPTWDKDDMCIRVAFGTDTEQDFGFSEFHHVYVNKNGTIADLLRALDSEGYPADRLQVVKEAATVYYGGRQKPFKVLWRPPTSVPDDYSVEQLTSVQFLEHVFGADSEVVPALEFNYRDAVQYQIGPNITFPETPAELLSHARALALQDDLHVYEASKLFVELYDPERSRACEYIDKIANELVLYFNDPTKVDADALDSSQLAKSEHNKQSLLGQPVSAAPQVDTRQTITVDRRMTLGELKTLLSEALALEPDAFKVSKGTVTFSTELTDTGASLDSLHLNHGANLILALGEPIKAGETRLKFVFFDASGKTLAAFRIDTDEEMTDASDQASDASPNESDKFEKEEDKTRSAQVVKKREHVCPLFELNVHQSIEISALKQTLLTESCRRVATHDKADMMHWRVLNHVAATPVLQLRIREYLSNTPSTIYSDRSTLRHAAVTLYGGKVLAVQILSDEIFIAPGARESVYDISSLVGTLAPQSENVQQPSDEEDDISWLAAVNFEVERCAPGIGEPITNMRTQVAPAFRVWRRDTLELESPVEIICHDDMPLKDLRAVLAKLFCLKEVGLAKPYGAWPATRDVLAIRNPSEIYWDKKVALSQYASRLKSSTVGSSPFYMHDGEIIYVRDNTVADKVLTADEEASLKAVAAAEAKARNMSSYYHRETTLKIQQRD